MKFISHILASVRQSRPEQVPPKRTPVPAQKVPATSQQMPATAATEVSGEPPKECAELARLPQILDCFVEDLERAGCAGEDRAAKLIYLALTSRVFQRPVSIAVKGPSSAGKSFTVEKVLTFFPAEAYYALTAMSDKALAYSEEPLQHRFLVLYEAAGMKSGLVPSFETNG